MKILFLTLLAFSLTACKSISDKPVNQLDTNLRAVVNHCKTCHSTNEMQRGPLLEGLEEWYMKHSTARFRTGLRGTHPKDIQGTLMHAAVKDLPEKEVMDAVEWFAGQERPEIKAVVKGNIKKGEMIYKESCFGCHEHVMGKFFSKSPDLYKLEDWYLLSQLRAYKRGWRGSETDDNHGASMRVAVDTMEEQDFKDITAYLATFQKKPE